MTAAEKILQKQLVGSGLDSSQWNQVQASLRDRAFFSSKVTSIKLLSEARRMVADRAGGQLSASEIRRDLRKVLAGEGYQAPDGKDGKLEDLSSKRRLDMIVDFNVRQARGFMTHLQATTPGALAAFPCQELYRQRERQQKRNWIQRWTDAGGQTVRGGRMITLTTDPIWSAISAFGNPFPPFDHGSGMGVRPVSRKEALELGVITEEDSKKQVEDSRAVQTKTAKSFNAGLETEIDPADAPALAEAFGDQIEVKGTAAKWRSFNTVADFAGKKFPGPSGKMVTISADALDGIPEDLLCLLPSMLRSGGGDAFSGVAMKPLIVADILKGIKLS